MFKNIILALMIMLGLSAYGGENYLSSVVIDETDNVTSIVLRSDMVTKVKKTVDGSDKIVLTLKNIKQSNSINTLYKNVNNVKGLVIQNDLNDLKIYVESPQIAKANIVFETPNSAPIVVNDNAKNQSRFLWTIISFVLLIYAMKRKTKPVKKNYDEIIKEREKQLYKNFQKEVKNIPSINYNLKAYSKHVLKGETIRSYESRMQKINN